MEVVKEVFSNMPILLNINQALVEKKHKSELKSGKLSS